MPKVSSVKLSPIAKYLVENKAIAKHDKNGCHFISPEGLYLGRLTKTVVDNYRVISLCTFGDGLKRLYSKSVAIGQQYAYLVNKKSPIGISLVPVKTFMRKIFVDFIERTSNLEDSEKTLTNRLSLITLDKETGVGLYNSKTPLKFETTITKSENKKLSNRQFIYTKH